MGLHGALYGEGDGGLLDWRSDAKWLVVEVELETVVDLGGKVKFPKCEIKYCGDRKGACKYLQENGCAGRKIIGGISISGDNGKSISGDYGTSISGHFGISTSGHFGISASEDYGISTSRYGGKSISGDAGESTSGHKGTSISGHWGTSTSGCQGVSISGNNGIIISEDGGTCQSGKFGRIISEWWCDNRYRIVVGLVGEDGIEANVPYKLDENDKWIKIDESSKEMSIK